MKERSTLTTNGITFTLMGRSGKASYHYTPLTISVSYRHHLGMYVINAFGNDLFCDKSAVVCLERATSVILAHYASKLIPMWDAA